MERQSWPLAALCPQLAVPQASASPASPASQSPHAPEARLHCACTGPPLVQGAGKTTLVNYILSANHGKRIAVIEVGAWPVRRQRWARNAPHHMHARLPTGGCLTWRLLPACPRLLPRCAPYVERVWRWVAAAVIVSACVDWVCMSWHITAARTRGLAVASPTPRSCRCLPPLAPMPAEVGVGELAGLAGACACRLGRQRRPGGRGRRQAQFRLCCLPLPCADDGLVVSSQEEIFEVGSALLFTDKARLQQLAGRHPC